MDAYALHLAMAALVGASFVAVSAYYMHRKTLTQLLDFARALERERDRERGAGDEEADYGQQVVKKGAQRRGGPVYRRKAAYYKRGGGSASLPEMALVGAEVDGEAEGDVEELAGPMMNGQFFAPGAGAGEGMLIPPGLPRLHTVHEGIYGSPQLYFKFSPE